MDVGFHVSIYLGSWTRIGIYKYHEEEEEDIENGVCIRLPGVIISIGISKGEGI